MFNTTDAAQTWAAWLYLWNNLLGSLISSTWAAHLDDAFVERELAVREVLHTWYVSPLILGVFNRRLA
jgi:hypothetical protein